MPDYEQLDRLKDVEAWNAWRAGDGKDTRINLSEANLEKAHLPGANLSDADLSGTYLNDADLSGAKLSRAKLSGAYLARADFRAVDFSGANLSGANLSGANLSSANLRRANLLEVDLTAADLLGTNLTGANLSKAHFFGAKLDGADFRGANVSSAQYLPDKVVSAAQSAKDIADVVTPTTVQESIERLGTTDPADFQQVTATQMGVLEAYRREALSQSRLSFWVALGGAAAGLALFAIAVGFSLLYGLSVASIVPLIAGAIVQVVSGIVFYLYGKTSSQLGVYHVQLEVLQRYLLANSISEGLSTATERDKARAALIVEISRAPSNSVVAATARAPARRRRTRAGQP